MKLGFDFDGVITNPFDLKRQWILDNIGIEVIPEQVSHNKTAVIGKDAYERMTLDIYASDLALKNTIRPEAIVVMASLKRRGNEIYVITARPNNQARYARQLLAMHNVPHDCFYNTEYGPKDKVCRNLGVDVFVDDSQSTLLEISVVPKIKLIFFNVFREEVAPGLISVSSWEELERLVCNMC